MDITEIQKRRDELRIRVAALIGKFEVETGMQVQAIDLHDVGQRLEGGRAVAVCVEVKLP